MPLYEYQCTACAHRFERIVKFSDPPLRICPSCGQQTVEQLLSAPAVQFKGSGWYVTDYARKSSASSTASSSGKSDGSKEAVSSSSESGTTPPASPSPSTPSSPSSGATSGEGSTGSGSK